jgi:hypothetical protein
MAGNDENGREPRPPHLKIIISNGNRLIVATTILRTAVENDWHDIIQMIQGTIGGDNLPRLNGRADG